MPGHTNRLAKETSPYLLQHAHNPVDWWPWGDEAFEEARRRDVPVFLSVGYSTCHWCHVMERESFEDEGLARLLNEGFVPVKVDREERPDVDSVYMTAVQALTGQGGWPMSVWLDHDRRPFYAGTYFPPDDRWGRPGFAHVLERLRALWETEREMCVTQAGQLAGAIAAELSLPGADEAVRPGPEVADAAAAFFLSRFDPRHGGFGHAPKFPQPRVLRLLLRYHRRTRDPDALLAVTRTLDAMHAGGIYDHVGGGFARYSTDALWRVPHFEKMLYDNAELAVTYLEAFQATGERRFADVAEDVLDYLDREMSAPGGGFFSATDADSDGEEGRFYVWTPAEIDAVVGPERGRVVRRYFGVTDEGDLEGRSVLHLSADADADAVAEAFGLEPGSVRETIGQARGLLRAARAKRVPPATDDKVLAEWNGLAISAFAVAARALDRPDLAERAATAARFVLDHLVVDGRLHRAFRTGQARHPGTLADHATLAAGCVDLLEATGDMRWLDEAIALHEILESRFRDARGGYFSVADDVEGLLTRPREIQDGAVPSGTSVATLTNLRLFALTGDRRWRDTAEAALDAAGAVLAEHPMVAPALACAIDWAADRPIELVVVRGDGDDGAALLDEARRRFLPNAVLLVTGPADGDAGAGQGGVGKGDARRLPLLEDRVAVDGRATAYLCREGVCRLPTSDPAELGRMLDEASGPAPAAE